MCIQSGGDIPACSLLGAEKLEYQEALAKLHELTRMGISPGLERIEELTRRLGSPQKRLPCCVHISGTNGKGSVAAMLEAMLRQQGRKTALFTSPHLRCHTERYLSLIHI